MSFEKVIYVLKQAPRTWNHCLIAALLKLGFQASRSDTSLFFYITPTVKLFVLVYVDDLLLLGNNASSIQPIITQLQTILKLKDLGKLHYFLGIEAM